MVTIFEKQHFFGEQCLTGQTVRTATATVLEEARVLRISQAKIIQTLRDEPTFTAVFLKYVLSHSLRVEEDLVDQLFALKTGIVTGSNANVVIRGEQRGIAEVPKISMGMFGGAERGRTAASQFCRLLP